MIAEVKRTPGGAVVLDGIALRDETVAKIKETIVAAGNPKICWRPFWSATMHRVIYM